MEIALYLVYALLILWLIQRWRFFAIPGTKRWWFQVVFILKLIAGSVLFYFYSHAEARGNADIFKYFDDSKIIYEAFWEHPSDFFTIMLGGDVSSEYFQEKYLQHAGHWYKVYDSQIFNNNRTLIRLNVLFRFVSLGAYHIHSLLMCFLSLIGLTALLKAFQPHVQHLEKWAFVGIFLLPSTLLWSSGVLKESLLFLWLGLFLLLLRKAFEVKSWRIVFLLLILVYLMFITKYYFLLALLPALIGLLISKKWKHTLALNYGVAIGACVGTAFLISALFPDFDFVKLFVGKRNDMIAHANAVNAGSLFDSNQLSANFGALFGYLPRALLDAIIQPLPWKTSNPLAIMAFVEMVLLIGFGAMCWLKRKKDLPSSWLYFLFTTIFITLIIIGITTPVSGTLVRYRVPVLPLMVIFALLIFDPQKNPFKKTSSCNQKPS